MEVSEDCPKCGHPCLWTEDYNDDEGLIEIFSCRSCGYWLEIDEEGNEREGND